MDHKEFALVVERQIDSIRDVLITKNASYNDGDDALRNFRLAGMLADVSPKQALWGMHQKHIISVADMIKSDKFYPPEVWDEKIGDAINYFILLRGLVFDLDVDPVASPIIN